MQQRPRRRHARRYCSGYYSGNECDEFTGDDAVKDETAGNFDGKQTDIA